MSEDAVTVPIETLQQHLEDLATDYYDLQLPKAYRIDGPPSALEALRMVNRAHPTVIKDYSPMLRDEDWTLPSTYTDIQGDTPVTIAITDDGLADSVRKLADGTTAFVKPLDATMPMSTFLARLTDKEEKEALYLQSQDGNIYRATPGVKGEPDLAPFQAVVARDVAWMKEALRVDAEAVNLWIGDSASTTSFHHDPYENIYTVLSGSKTFTLLSPIEGLWFNQRFHPPATLVRDADNTLVPTLDQGSTYDVPWVAELLPPHQTHPIVVTVTAGETLYLPAGWWHKVEQAAGEHGLAVAVNYWYANEMRAEHYALHRLAARVARTAGRNGVIPVDPEVELDEGVWGSEVESGDEWDPKDWGR